MKFYQDLILKDGQTCLHRNARASDAEALFEHFVLTHEQTDNMITYSDEKDFGLKKEVQSLQKIAPIKSYFAPFLTSGLWGRQA
ncbi:hypothetical protein [Streptococcus massiliensis]|uniref:Uncharacterized protein n=1 Tax=Streptococcus massiliensis TaxID=313439 RepID=A0A380KX18_9STRE|nr:hypothetical protein [Streptococcus massiliensis]SUN76101.1 Uncharacterised protein [Streptococcus massiliensis]